MTDIQPRAAHTDGDMDIIPLAEISRWKPCSSQMAQIEKLYPQGIPMTAEAISRLRNAGVDVIWGACHLMTRAERRQFIIFTLHQRQPSLVSLFVAAKLHDHAAAIARLDWIDLHQARTILQAAAGAAWAAGAAIAAAGAAWAAVDAARAVWTVMDATAWAAEAAAGAARAAEAAIAAAGAAVAARDVVDEQLAWLAANIPSLAWVRSGQPDA